MIFVDFLPVRLFRGTSTGGYANAATSTAAAMPAIAAAAGSRSDEMLVERIAAGDKLAVHVSPPSRLSVVAGYPASATRPVPKTSERSVLRRVAARQPLEGRSPSLLAVRCTAQGALGPSSPRRWCRPGHERRRQPASDAKVRWKRTRQGATVPAQALARTPSLDLGTLLARSDGRCHNFSASSTHEDPHAIRIEFIDSVRSGDLRTFHLTLVLLTRKRWAWRNEQGSARPRRLRPASSPIAKSANEDSSAGVGLLAGQIVRRSAQLNADCPWLSPGNPTPSRAAPTNWFWGGVKWLRHLFCIRTAVAVDAQEIF